MHKNSSRLQQMISRYLAGKSTKEEVEFLDAYDHLFNTNVSATDTLTEEESANLERKLERNILAIIEPDKKVVRMWPRIAAAASVCIILAAGSYFLLNKRHTTEPVVAKIQPGSNKAILTLANGSQIILSADRNGQIAAQKGANVVKSVNGPIAYIQSENKPAGTDINTVATPNGGQYEVILPDGTKVWLNAASSLSFPVSFADAQNRMVQLKGEAYFEVAKDQQHPFIVKTADQQVQVLGTHFNISAYSDEPGTLTTLLEGAVRVTSEDAAATLVPNQQSSLKEGRLGVKEVIAEDAIAWKEGYFRFNNEPLEEVLRKIGRWYNVTVVYKDEEIKHKTVYGTMSRFSNITDVVKLLELTKAARFEINENKIFALKYQLPTNH
jgi:transmembrane sensor